MKLDKLRQIIGVEKLTEKDLEPPKQTREEVRQRVLPVIDPVEARKDTLDLKPNIDFVSSHIDNYEQAYDRFLMASPIHDNRLAKTVKFEHLDSFVGPQVGPNEVRLILARMPEALVKLSKLKKVSYSAFGEPGVIPIPTFNEDGSCNCAG